MAEHAQCWVQCTTLSSPSLPPSPDKVGADFTLEVEVYCSLPPEEPVTHTKPSTPIKMLKRLRGNKVYTCKCEQILGVRKLLLCLRLVISQDVSDVQVYVPYGS